MVIEDILSKSEVFRILKFGIAFFPREDSRIIAHYIELAENCGFDYAWVTDQFFNRDVFVTLGLAAVKTRKIKLGTGVVNPYTRHVAVLASSAATLDEVSDARAVLGIGAGGIELNSLCLPEKNPLKGCRETIQVVTRLLRNEIVSYDGEVIKLDRAKISFKAKGKIPIYLGARGPLMFQLGGELADGVVTHGITENYLKFILKNIEKGEEKAQKSLHETDVAIWVTGFSITKEPEIMKNAVRLSTAFALAGTPKKAMEALNLEERTVKGIAEALSKGELTEAANLITDKVIQAFSIIGNEDECISAIERLVKNGVSQVIIRPIETEVEATIKNIGKKVIPYFREL
jgi:5,10-methylenetetrahydromethanopterin reductase